MKKTTKIVNIYPSIPIIGINPPIRSVVKRVTKSISEIRTCLMARAIVEEVLPDGKTVRLNIGNYDKFADEDVNVVNCACGNSNCNCGWKIQAPTRVEEPVIVNEDEKSAEWKAAYEKALAGKNLAGMTRKQRRSIEAAARAAADAAVSEASEVVMGVATVETVDNETSEESVESAELTETVDETPVETIDIEDVNSASAE